MISKGIMEVIEGDVTNPRILDNRHVIIPHVCNDQGIIGAGVALALRKQWESVYIAYRKQCDVHSKNERLGKVSYADVGDKIFVANMIAQKDFKSSENPRPLKYAALVKCMEDVAWFAKSSVIHTPKFGGDLACGNFAFIMELMEEIWLENGIDVIIYDFPAK